MKFKIKTNAPVGWGNESWLQSVRICYNEEDGTFSVEPAPGHDEIEIIHIKSPPPDSQQGDVCPECYGHKVTDYAGVVQLCPECNGTGVIYDVFTDTERECKCNGTGRETK